MADGANRALGKLLSKYYLNKGLGIGTYTKLYESCVVPVMDYCSSIWGYNDNDKLDKIHMKAIRCYLGVNRYAPKAGIEGEIGWTPPKISRHLNILRLWNKIVSMENTRLPRVIYNFLHISNIGKTWATEVKSIFSIINCKDVYDNNVPIINLKAFLSCAKNKLLAQHIVTWKREIDSKSKLCVFKQYKKEYVRESYCELNLKRSQRSHIAKLRLGILPIHIETGRYNGLDRNMRVCLVCNNGYIEDEYHVMFQFMITHENHL